MTMKAHWSEPFDADETVESLEAERDALASKTNGAVNHMIRAYYENRIRLARDQDRHEPRVTKPEIITPPIFPELTGELELADPELVEGGDFDEDNEDEGWDDDREPPDSDPLAEPGE